MRNSRIQKLDKIAISLGLVAFLSCLTVMSSYGTYMMMRTLDTGTAALRSSLNDEQTSREMDAALIRYAARDPNIEDIRVYLANRQGRDRAMRNFSEGYRPANNVALFDFVASTFSALISSGLFLFWLRKQKKGSKGKGVQPQRTP